LNRDHFELALARECEYLFPAVLEFTREMIQTYSVLGNELAALEVVERRLQKLELPVARVPMDWSQLSRSPHFAPVDWNYREKYNLACGLNSQAPGRSLVLNGHLDVVPAEPFDMWTRPPTEPWEKDGWLFGRGAGDMQSGVAAMIYAVHAINAVGYRVTSPLNIQVVIEEECSGNGALACLQHGYTGDFVLIPEPFGPSIYTGQIGVLWFKVSVEGVPAHVLSTSDGSNAIESLWQIFPYLKNLEIQLNAESRPPPYDEIAHPYNLNIGKISGGTWSSSVPSYAELEGRIGFPVTMSVEEAIARVGECVQRAGREVPAFKDFKPVVHFYGLRSQGHLVDLEHPGIKCLTHCHQAVTGQEIGHYLSTCTTDLRAFHVHDGTSGTCYGPIAKNIHGVDECVNLESVLLTLKTYALFISRWCDLEQM
jgi:acetylornithine deacetylase